MRTPPHFLGFKAIHIFKKQKGSGLPCPDKGRLQFIINHHHKAYFFPNENLFHVNPNSLVERFIWNGRFLRSSLTRKKLNAIQHKIVREVCSDVIVPWCQGDSFTLDFFGVPGWTFPGNSFYLHITNLCNNLPHDLFNKRDSCFPDLYVLSTIVALGTSADVYCSHSCIKNSHRKEHLERGIMATPSAETDLHRQDLMLTIL